MMCDVWCICRSLKVYCNLNEICSTNPYTFCCLLAPKNEQAFKVCSQSCSTIVQEVSCALLDVTIPFENACSTCLHFISAITLFCSQFPYLGHIIWFFFPFNDPFPPIFPHVPLVNIIVLPINIVKKKNSIINHVRKKRCEGT